MIMSIVLTLIVRFAQCVGVVGILTGVSFFGSLAEYVVGIQAGKPWTIGELARRFAIVSGPCFIGGFIAAGTQVLLRRHQLLERRRKQFPSEPWRWDPQWDTNRIRTDNRSSLVILVFFWGLFAFIVLPAGVSMAEIKLKAGIYWFLGAFGLILYAFTKNMLQNRQWNRSELVMETMPGVIGGPLRAMVVLQELFPPQTLFRVQIRCIRTETRGSTSDGESISRADEIVWQDEIIVEEQTDAGTPGTTAIPVSFGIPYSCSPTENLGSLSIDWFLAVKRRSDTDPREARFPIPVFRTSKSSPNYRHDDTAIKPYLARADAEAILNRLGMYRERKSDGTELFQFFVRPPGMLPGALVVVAMCLAAIVASFVFLKSPLVYFAALIPAAMLLAAAWGLAEILLWKSTLSVGPTEITAECGYQGFQSNAFFPRPDRAANSSSVDGKAKPRPKNVPQILPLECRMEFRKSDGEWWSVCLPFPDGTQKPLIKRLDGRREAESVRDWLNAQLRSTGDQWATE